MPVSESESPLDSPRKPPCSASYSHTLARHKSRRAAIVEHPLDDYLVMCLKREIATCRT